MKNSVNEMQSEASLKQLKQMINTSSTDQCTSTKFVRSKTKMRTTRSSQIAQPTVKSVIDWITLSSDKREILSYHITMEREDQDTSSFSLHRHYTPVFIFQFIL